MKDINAFLAFEKVEIIEKTDVRATIQFNPSDLFQTQSLIVRQEIFGNGYLM